jgi:hypothetical protein
MLDSTRRLLAADPDTLVADALGLAGLCVAIVAMLCLPIFA